MIHALPRGGMDERGGTTDGTAEKWGDAAPWGDDRVEAAADPAPELAVSRDGIALLLGLVRIFDKLRR